MKPIDRNYRQAFFSVILASIAFIVPAIHFGSVGHSAPFNLLWSEGFSNQLWQGILYPRWLPNLNAGCGSPVFFFYPPLVYYVAAIFKPLFSFMSPPSWYPIIGATFITVFTGSYFLYAWLRSITINHRAALGAALLYIFMPYTVWNFYWRQDITEFTVFALLPALLFFCQKLVDGNKFAPLGLFFFFAIFMMSSVPGVIVSSAVPVFYLIFIAWNNAKGWKILYHAFFIILLACCLAAIYLVPIVPGMEHILMGHKKDAMWGGTFNYSRNFLFSSTMLDRRSHIYGSLIIYCTYLAIMTLIFFRTLKARAQLSKKQLRTVFFWLGIFAASLFCMSSLSQFLWELVPFVQIVQFPWRLCLVTTLVFCVIFSFHSQAKKLSRLTNHPLDHLHLAVGLGLLFYFVLAATPMFNSYSRIPPSDSVADKESNVASYLLRIAVFEYRPISIDNDVFSFENGNVFELAKTCARQTAITSGNGQVHTKRWDARHIEVSVNASTTANVEISQFYYPGWTAYSANGQSYSLSPSERYGLLSFTVPEGQHHITLKLEKSFYEKLGAGISLSAFLIFAIYYYAVWIRPRSKT